MSWDDVRTRGDAPLDPTASHVLLVIATHANRYGEAWPMRRRSPARRTYTAATVVSKLRRIEAGRSWKRKANRPRDATCPANPPPPELARHPALAVDNSTETAETCSAALPVAQDYMRRRGLHPL